MGTPGCWEPLAVGDNRSWRSTHWKRRGTKKWGSRLPRTERVLSDRQPPSPQSCGSQGRPARNFNPLV